MTREKYLIIRDLPTIPIEDWFDYYKERGGTLSNLQEFQQFFYTCLQNQTTVVTGGRARQITLPSALNNFYNYYNKKYGLERTETTGGSGGVSSVG